LFTNLFLFISDSYCFKMERGMIFGCLVLCLFAVLHTEAHALVLSGGFIAKTEDCMLQMLCSRRNIYQAQ